MGRFLAQLNHDATRADLGLAAELLGKTLPATKEGDPALAAELLEKVVPVTEQAVAALTKALNDDEYRVRIAALDALGRIGSPAIGAFPAIAKLVHDGVADVRTAAVAAMLHVQKK